MQDANDADFFGLDAVDRDVRGAAHDVLARSLFLAFPVMVRAAGGGGSR